MSAERIIPAIPLATYRLQFDGGFRLADARAIVPYLHSLGVTHIYASPLMRARKGSTHGYDAVDSHMLDPARGSMRDLRELVAELRNHGMGLILDIVPNHMAASHENPAWDDLLKHGRAARRARWFDVDWYSEEEELQGRVFVPVLGKPLGAAIAAGELRLEYRAGELRLRYWSNDFPLDPRTVPRVLSLAQAELAAVLGAEHPHVVRLSGLLERLRRLPRRDTRSRDEQEFRSEQAVLVAAELDALVQESSVVNDGVQRALEQFAAGAEGHRRMRRLLRSQAYELAFWRRAAREINYRRFFNIDELVALRAEREWVFEETHSLILDLVGEGLVDGLRVDHVDGLRDPQAYLERLVRRAAERRGAPVPVWVEKILAPHERLRDAWPVAGTTGYEVLNELESLFVDPEGERLITRAYEGRMSGARGARPFVDVARGAKRLVLATSLAADLRRLTILLERWLELEAQAGGAREPASIDVASQPRLPSRRSMERAMAATIAALSVYRSYVRAGEDVHRDDREWLTRALEDAREEADPHALVLLSDALLGGARAAEPDESGLPAVEEPHTELAGVERARIRFVERFQQVTGPAAAKGVEDTALYRRLPLASLCEVGGEPDRDLEGALHGFHEACATRAARWPHNMVAVTTHDTKRSADVRARLDALAAMPDDWLAAVRQWRRLAKPMQGRAGRRAVPDMNTEWLIWQTLVGVWPVSDEQPNLPSRADMESLLPRVREYMKKAVREGRERSSWVDPDEEFEAKLDSYLCGVLDLERSAELLQEVNTLATRAARLGCWISLARTLLQLTSPGFPDVYQGDELWNLTLVDPDNRRAVDFVHRAAMLGTLERAWGAGDSRRKALLEELTDRPMDGRIKLHFLRRTLAARAANPLLFQKGTYQPLEVVGPYSDSIVAFARELESHTQTAIVVAVRMPHMVEGVTSGAGVPFGEVWSRTTLHIPERLCNLSWRCALSGNETVGAELSMSAMLHDLPGALLVHA